jgi:undecaprenyl-diphosphatase
MFNWFEQLDQDIVLAVNSWNHPVFDFFFSLVSGKFFWIPIYCVLLFLVFKKLGWKNALLFLGMVAVCIFVVDSGSVYLFKEVFKRYRPSHHLQLSKLLHFQLDSHGQPMLGGQYGFISSHAANFAAITCMVGLLLKNEFPKLIYWLAGITLLVCYSRIYLGMHYLSDVVVGALWGAGIGYLFYKCYLLLLLQTKKRSA